MKWKGTRVFVSGGAGVIGSELVALLHESGASVFVGDLKTRPAPFPASVRYRRGDLNTLSQAEWDDFSPQVFIHLAATFERSEETIGFWEENFHHNVSLSHHLMTLARAGRDLERVVFASSYLIYDPALYQFDRPPEQPASLRESDPIAPRNLTGMAKLSHEVELRYLNEFVEYPFTSVSARIFRGFGRNSRDIISRWVRALLKGEDIQVYRAEGQFDYLYARDAAAGLMHLATAVETTGPVNLGTGQARRVADVVEILRTHFPDLQAHDVPSDIPFEASQADLALLTQATDWQPTITLETAIAEVVEFERLHAEQRRPAPLTPRVLVSSSSGKAPLVLAVRDAARRLDLDAQVIAGDMDEEAITQHVADEFWVMPRTDSEHLEEILEGCRARGVTAVLPTRDGELSFWARAHDQFAASGIEVIVSPTDSIEHCLDKLVFAEWGAERGLPVIPAATTPEGVGSGPYVVKERYGAGSRSIGLSLEREAALRHAEELESPIFQPYVSGREISIDAWFDRHHQARGVVLRGRDLVIDGESRVTTTFRDLDLEDHLFRTLPALELRGPVVLQALLNPESGPQFIECNTRIGGASTTSIAAGLDSLFWSLLEAADPDAVVEFHRIEGEVRQVRLPEDRIIRLSARDDTTS